MAAEDYEGMKPLDLAEDNDHEECAALLFRAIKPSLLVRWMRREGERGGGGGGEGKKRERVYSTRVTGYTVV